MTEVEVRHDVDLGSVLLNPSPCGVHNVEVVLECGVWGVGPKRSTTFSFWILTQKALDSGNYVLDSYSGSFNFQVITNHRVLRVRGGHDCYRYLQKSHATQ